MEKNNFVNHVPEEIRKPDKEHLELENLFAFLVRHYTWKYVLQYIDTNADVASNVVTMWFSNQNDPSESIRRKILGCLRELKKETLAASIDSPIPAVENKVVPIELPQKPASVAQPKKRPFDKKEFEAQGRYDNLNIYESNLLDYLKATFTDSEFNTNDIQFPQMTIRRHSYFLQHLKYLVEKGYLKPPIVKEGRYYFKVK